MEVKLLTTTHKMAENLWLIWQLSRSLDPIEEILASMDVTEVRTFFAKIIEEDIPLAEMIDFIFLLEDIPISLREQLVRHRIGIKLAGQSYVDTIPDLSDSSFWSQSMRVMDMGLFEYFTPESIKKIPLVSKNKLPQAVYAEAMTNAARAYNILVDAGIPREDARNVIPLGATHRIVWKLNLAALKHIIGKRGCWILQLGLWRPIIEGVVNELVKIDECFRSLICPPCIKHEKFIGCLFCENNKARIIGDVDKLPPCPLYLYYEIEASEIALCENTLWSYNDWNKFFSNNIEAEQQMRQMREDYQKLWDRDVDTGALL